MTMTMTMTMMNNDYFMLMMLRAPQRFLEGRMMQETDQAGGELGTPEVLTRVPRKPSKANVL